MALGFRGALVVGFGVVGFGVLGLQSFNQLETIRILEYKGGMGDLAAWCVLQRPTFLRRTPVERYCTSCPLLVPGWVIARVAATEGADVTATW